MSICFQLFVMSGFVEDFMGFIGAGLYVVGGEVGTEAYGVIQGVVPGVFF